VFPEDVISPLALIVLVLIFCAFNDVVVIDGVLIFVLTIKLFVVILVDVKFVDLIFKDVIKFVIFKLVPFIVIAIIVGILIVPLAVIFAVVIFAQVILPVQLIKPELLILLDVNVKIFAVDVINVVEVNVDVKIDDDIISFVIFKDNPEIEEDALIIPTSNVPSFIIFK